MTSRVLLGAAMSGSLICSLAPAQIRIATYNIEADIDGFTAPRPGLQTVLEGIGAETVNGFARPLDIITLQETTSNVQTVQPIVNSMNARYGAGVYAMSPYQGTQAGTNAFGNGPNALVYNTQTLQLIASVGIGTPSSNGPPRQEIRYQFRPIGYGPNADFFVYCGHYKSAADLDSENRRLAEAQLVRTDAAGTLTNGGRILYTGDFNPFKNSSEPAWQLLMANGTGTLSNNRAIDPINLGNGTWDDQNPAFDFAYSDSTTNLRYRDDLQFQTGPTNDGHGFSYIGGSHHVFGNNGTTPINGAATSSFNTALPGMANRSAILSALTSASDHYPVIADYRLPAKMSVSVGSTPSQVIVGANVGVNVNVTNSAPVQIAIGADGLDYSVTSSGSLSGSANGTNVQALSAGGSHTLTLNTSSVGTASGTVSVTSTSQEVANGTFSQAVSVQVIDHAQPSFNGGSSVNVATIDFGIKGRTLGGGSASFSIFNRFGAGTTAALDLDSVNGSGSTSQLTTNAATFSNLAAGSSQSFLAMIEASSNGSLSATYTLNLSDQNLLGATTRGPLTLVLKGIVATPGDTDLNNIIDGADYARVDTTFNNEAALNTDIGGWNNGDFDGNGKVDGSDYALIDSFFNGQSGPGAMQGVPEPSSLLLVGGLGALAASARRRRIR